MFYLWGVFLDLDTYIFPWHTCFICGVVLEWSCTQINMVLFKMKKEKIMRQWYFVENKRRFKKHVLKME